MALVYSFVNITFLGDPVFGLTLVEIFKNSIVDN